MNIESMRVRSYRRIAADQPVAVEDAAERSRTLKAYEIPATVTAVMDCGKYPFMGKARIQAMPARKARDRSVATVGRVVLQAARQATRAPSAGNAKRFLMDLLGALPFPLLSVQPAARSAAASLTAGVEGCPAGTAPHRR